MPMSFEMPGHDALLAGQAAVQAEKFQGRVLADYNDYIFPGQDWVKQRGSAVADFVTPIVGDTERVTLERVLKSLTEARPEQPIHWVDMGGGHALAMRQFSAAPNTGSRLKMTNVDLFDYGLEGLGEAELEGLENLAPGMTKPEAEPALTTDNMETVKLPELADVITSVETMQYLNDPLEALSNWYNQLADNGLLLVATDHNWSGRIRYQRTSGSPDRDEKPTKHLLEALDRAGVNYAVTEEMDYSTGERPPVNPNKFSTMAIQKKPGTMLRLTQPVIDAWVNQFNYKAVYYETPTARSPIVEVVKTDAETMLGAMTMAAEAMGDAKV